MSRSVPRHPLRLTLAAFVLGLSSLTAAALPASAGSSDGQGGNVALNSESLPVMAPGQAGWVSLNWEGDSRDATSFQVTASEPTGAVTISYPTNTGAFSAPYRESQLLAGATDYTSFYLKVAPNVSGSARITFHLAYDEKTGNGGGSGSLKHYTADIPLTLTIIQAGGSAFSLATSTVSVAKATPAWVKVTASASAPGVTGVSVTVSGPPGLVVDYPGSGSSTSLNADPNLDKGETDYFSFRLDASALAAGRYDLTLNIGYGAGQRVSRTIALVVT